MSSRVGQQNVPSNQSAQMNQNRSNIQGKPADSQVDQRDSKDEQHEDGKIV